MRGICRLLGAIVVAGGVWQALGGLELATAQVATKQIALTEKQVERFIAAQRKMSAAKAEDEFEAIAREYGFAGIDEHDDVEANILLLMEGIDPQSRAFLEPPVQIKRRIEETNGRQVAAGGREEAGPGRADRGAQERQAHPVPRQRRAGEEVLRQDPGGLAVG